MNSASQKLLLCVILCSTINSNYAFISIGVHPNVSVATDSDDTLSERLLEDNTLSEPLLEDDTLSEPLLEDDTRSKSLLEDNTLSEPLLEDDTLSEPLLEGDTLSEPLEGDMSHIINGLMSTDTLSATVAENVSNETTVVTPAHSQTYDRLYEQGIQHYLENEWHQCVAYLQSAIQDYHWYHDVLVR